MTPYIISFAIMFLLFNLINLVANWSEPFTVKEMLIITVVLYFIAVIFISELK